MIDVRYGALCGLKSDISRGPRSANNELMQCSKKGSLFITSSARASSDGGTVSPKYIGRHVVDDWLEPGRPHDRQLGLLRADWLNQSGQARLRRRHRQYVA